MEQSEAKQMVVTSPAFENGADIPSKFSCDGESVSPPLDISMIPHGTMRLAIIAEDPDTSKGVFDHWIAWNIQVVPHIEENASVGISGKNGSGKTGYHPPCPPSGSHRYFFEVFALDNVLDLPAGADKQMLKDAMQGHILAQATLMGKYEKLKVKSEQ